MPGSLSGHLIDQFNPNSPLNSSIVAHGAMSFNPTMHGTPYAQQSFSFFGSQAQQSFANDSISEETARRIATLQVKLNQKLGPEYISQRPGPGGGPKLTYVEGWKIINLANEVFGFNGWCSSIINLTTDFVDYNEETRRYSVGVTALMRVTLRDGVFHEDIGYGMLENSKSKGPALDKCKKEAVTDGLKRALRSFGNVMGNCLYDKSYTSEVIKVKFEPKKFNKEELHRRPEFDDTKPNVASTSMNSSISTSNNAPRAGPSTVTPTRPPLQQNQSRPIAALPSHLRTEVFNSGSGPTTYSNAAQQFDAQGKSHAQSTGLNTPITTPLQQPRSSAVPQKPQRFQQPPETRQPAAGAKTIPAPSCPPKVELDEDESFGFNSDDDAFLAMADLGPAIGGDDSDMGRPIIADEDTGRPIDHEEGLLLRPDDDSTEVPMNQRREIPGRQASASSSSSAAGRSRTRQELIAAALADSKLESGNGKSDLGTNQQNNESTMPPPPVPQLRTTTSLAQQNHQRYMQNRQNKDQNQMPAPQTSLQTYSNMAGQLNGNPAAFGRGNDTLKRPQPSIGGFSFPSSTNTGQSVGSATSSGIGIKRPAEAMNFSPNSMNPTSNYRSATPGMGLHNSAGASHGRSILGALDITDSGDVKRRRS